MSLHNKIPMEGVENALANGLSVLYALLQRLSPRAAEAVSGASSFYVYPHRYLSILLPAWLQQRVWEQPQLQGQSSQQQHQLQPNLNRAAASMVAKGVFAASLIYVTLIVVLELLTSFCRRAARRSSLFDRSVHRPHEPQTEYMKQQQQQRDQGGKVASRRGIYPDSSGTRRAETLKSAATDSVNSRLPTSGLHMPLAASCSSSSSERCPTTTQSAQQLQQDKTAYDPVPLQSHKWFLLTTLFRMLCHSLAGSVAFTGLLLLWCDDPLLFTHVLRPASTYKPLSAGIFCLTAIASTLLLVKGLLQSVSILWRTFTGSTRRRSSSSNSSSSSLSDKSSNTVDPAFLPEQSGPTLNSSSNSTTKPQSPTASSSSISPKSQLHLVYHPLFLTSCLAKDVPFAHALIILFLFGFGLKHLCRSVATLTQFYSCCRALISPAASAQQHRQQQAEQQPTITCRREGGSIAQMCLKAERFGALLQPLITIVIAVSVLYHPLLQQLPGNARAVFFAKICIVVEVIFTFFACACVVENYFKQLRPPMFTFLLLTHTFAFVGLLLLFTHPHRWRIFFEVYGFYVITGLGITCGAHRLWAHRSYKAALPYRCLMLVLNSMANQGCIYHWARDHRVHHKHSDTIADPYNASRGFFYSHMGWLLLKKPDEVRLAGLDIDCSDLLNDGCVALQKKFDPWWNQIFCFFLPACYGYYAYGSFWLGFFVHGALRWCVVLHATWTVNSVAHFWGDRPYSACIRPRESIFTSFAAIGEGWHNWHHVYPFDYATAEGGFFQHYNPSKVVIDAAARLGLVWDRRRATGAWQRVLQKREQQKREEEEQQQMQQRGTASLQQLSPKQLLQLLECMRSAIPSSAFRVHTLRNLAALARDLLLLAAAYWLLLRLDTGLFPSWPRLPPFSSLHAQPVVVPSASSLGVLPETSPASAGHFADRLSASSFSSSSSAAAAAPATAAAGGAGVAAAGSAEEFAAHAAAFSLPLFEGVECLLLLLLRGCFVYVSGSLAFALFLHATRAAQGKFCATAAANNLLAFLLHALLLVPYKPRRLGRRCEAPATRTALYTCCFRLLLLAGGSCSQSSFFCCLSLACCYTYAAASLGFWREVLVLVVLPYIFCNCCMAYYYGALHGAAPHDSLNENDDFKHPSPEALQWLLGVRQQERKQQQSSSSSSSRRKRLRLLRWSMRESLQNCHLVEALTFEVSPQGLDEAAGILRELLDVLAAAAAGGSSVDSFVAAAAKVAGRAKQQQQQQQQQHKQVEEEEDEEEKLAAAAAAKGVACCPEAAAVNKKLVEYAVHQALNQEEAAAAADLLRSGSAAIATPCARKVAAAAVKAFGS